METFLIVDGNSLVFRAFHALPLLTYNDIYTNAVQGFFSMLFKAFAQEKPTYCAVCFDEHAPTFRHTVYENYKAGRKPTPDELRPQFPIIKELLQKMGLGVLSLEGYEADDLLGTLSKNANDEGVHALLLTGDRDALQLVDNMTQVLFTRKGITELQRFTPEEVLNVFEFTPEQVTDWKGLSGDSSDNIPGIPSVGDKTAVKLLREFSTLEGVLENADKIPGKLGEKVRANKEQALFSKELATIRRTAPVAYDMRSYTLNHLADALPAMRSYGLMALSKRLESAEVENKEEAAPVQVKETVFANETEIKTVAALEKAALEIGSQVCALHLGQTLTLAAENGECYFVSTQYDLLTPGIAPEEALLAVKPLLENGRLIMHDAKALLHRLDKLGINAAKPYFDTMIAQYLLNPQEKSYALANFAKEDAQGIFKLHEKQQALLKRDGMEELYCEMELPLIHALFLMEKEGFRVAPDVLNELGESFVNRITALRQSVYELTGVDGFNLNSPQQLGKVLFEDLGLPHGKKGKTGYSTSAEILEGLTESHPAIEKILEYRQLSKLQSTYIEGLLKLMDASGRVHSTFDQTATATGRISSNEPNLQNIPVRTQVGREIRRAFIPREGWVLLDADYSQIELRILAHFSGDPAMVEAFQKGQDIHTRTAAEVYDVPMDEVTPQMRSSAKAVNFGLVYGISEFGLARNIGISRFEAAEFIKKYFKRYPGVKKFMDDAVEKGQTEGYAVTMMGRRRYLPELRNEKSTVRDFGRRIAMNMPVQGTAADIIKLAMVQVKKELDEAKLQARLILQVHDELIIECPPEETEAACALLQKGMESIVKLKVPLVAEVNVGKSWYDTK
jgi:DNA polymerase I